MKKRNPVNWFQVLALCSALGLGGAFVWHRQKQADPPIKTLPVPVVTSETKDEEATYVEVKLNEQIILMPSSKSGSILRPLSNDDDEEKPKGPSNSRPRTGSDFITPLPGTDDPPSQRTLLPGSKNPIRILEPPKQQRTVLSGSKSIDAILKPQELTPQREEPPKKNNEKKP